MRIWYDLSMDEWKKNQILELLIDGYSSEGHGVGHVDARAIFVPQAIPGERWMVKLLKVGKGAVYAKGEQLLSPSAERITPLCPHFGKCGGCDTMHMSYAEELRFKLGRVNDALARIGGQSVKAEKIIGSNRQLAYRNKAIFNVAEVNGEPAFGFYRERSHQLVAIDHCHIQTELSCRVAKTATAFMRKHRFPVYDDHNGSGYLRHVFCRQACSGPDAVACIISARGFGGLTSALVSELRERCPELTGIVLNINKTRGNTVLAGDFYTLWGEPCIHDRLCGLSYEIAPRAFFQINPPQAERLYRQAAEYAFGERNELVLDLYCGAGTISLFLAGQAKRVIGAEIVPEAIENAWENAVRNGIDNVEFLCGDAGDAARALAARELRPDCVVVDPPRKGMAEDAVTAVASMQPERIVYVSCDPATLARDIRRFDALGYSLLQAAAVDMFPRTRHVETVCYLYHQKKDFISVPYEPKM